MVLKLKQFIVKNHRFVPLLVQFIFYVLLLFFFKIELQPQIELSYFSNFISSCAEAFILVCFALILSRLYRPLFLFPIILLTIFIFANIIYYRNFGDIVPPSFYEPKSFVFNQFVTDSIKSSVRWIDVLYFIPLLVSCVFYKFLRPEKLSTKSYIIIIFLTILSNLAAVGMSMRRIALRTELPSFKESVNRYNHEYNVRKLWYDKVLILGTWSYVYCILCDIMDNPDIELTTEEFDDLVSHILQQNQNVLHPDTAKIFENNKGKNLVFIEVESLCSSVLQQPYSQEIIPAISGILNDSTAIICKEMHILAAMGRSSDAQFMHNTGLLPLRYEALVNRFPLRDYPSIAKSLPSDYTSNEYIGEFRRLWGHNFTTLSYGFDNLYDKITEEIYTDRDSILFNFVIADLKKIKEPFFAFITTISMHQPYEVPTVKVDLTTKKAVENVKDERDRNYLYKLAHFDRQLSRFIDYLKVSGLYDNTIIVITGDHEPSSVCISESLYDTNVPFFILNSGIGYNCTDTNVTQADVFPTILDVMNLKCKIKLKDKELEWRGAGNSIFRGSGRQLSDKDWEISDKIIRGRLCSPI